jgi:hypothetical protein
MNKACKKDDFPLERVDKIVDDATNSEMSRSWTCSLGVIRSGSVKRTKKKQVLSLHSEYFVS